MIAQPAPSARRLAVRAAVGLVALAAVGLALSGAAGAAGAAGSAAGGVPDGAARSGHTPGLSAPGQALPPSLVAAAPTGPVPLPTPRAVAVVGTFESALGTGCSNWDAACPATALAPIPGAPGMWAATLHVPAGGWRWRVAVDGDAADAVGLGARVDGPDRTWPAGPARDVTVVFDARRWAAADDSSDPLAVVAPVAAGPCPAGPAASAAPSGAVPGPGSEALLGATLLDPDDDQVATAAFEGLPAGPACLAVQFVGGGVGAGAVVPPVPVAVDVPAGGRIEVAWDAVAGRATAWPAASDGRPAADGSVDPLGIRHDSRSPTYRTPSGAVPAGQPVRLRLRTFHGDATSVVAHVADAVAGTAADVPLAVVAPGIPCEDPAADAVATCDLWEATIMPAAPTTLRYRFVVADGASREFYGDDGLLDGGAGAASALATDRSWVVTVHVPGLAPVPWLDGAVVYQVFPDRFRNGSTANDASTDAARYRFPPDVADRNVRRAWGTPPESPNSGRDWFGGDLRGILQNLGYLDALGVDVLYLNPIFAAGSNHGYDTRNYLAIDPRFGTFADFEALVRAASKRGIRVVLDGVFNHVSSDSIYFDRYGHFPGPPGACESVSSSYRSWFTFTDEPGGPCAGPNGPHTMTYAAWSGIASLPVLVKTDPGVRSLVYAGPGSVAARWLRAGAAGWRLDVMMDPSFGTTFWPGFRAAVKAVNPDAAIVGELWTRDQVLPLIRGDAADTTMNYRFRNAVTGYLGTIDNEGFPDAGQGDQPPSVVARKLLGMYEDMPSFASLTAWNLLDSHDTERILWSLAPGTTPAEKQAPANLALAKRRLRLASLLQFTLPGAPTIYYGDEIGMTGGDDPDDRRTFPVLGRAGALPAAVDTGLLGWYRSLAGIRRATPVLRDGGIRFLVTDDRDRTMAFSRFDDAGNLAIVALNPDPTHGATVRVPLAAARAGGSADPVAAGVPDGVAFRDLLGGAAATSADGVLAVTLPPLGSALLVPAAPPPTALPAPAGLAAAEAVGSSAGQPGAALTWSAVAGAAGYEIERAPVAGGDYAPIGRADGTRFTDTPPVPATWHYVVRALAASGWSGRASADVSAVVGPAAGSPSPGPAAPSAAPSASIAAAASTAPSVPAASAEPATSAEPVPSAAPGSGSSAPGSPIVLLGVVAGVAALLVLPAVAIRRRTRR